jgi:GNAT superfamily N-acetyltransferase
MRPALQDAGPAFCCVLRDRGRGPVVGFAAVHATNPGWFGPMGVCPELQGRGLGGRLAIRAVQEAWDRGTDRLFLPWVNENEAFYRHVLGGMRRILHIKTGKSLLSPGRP